MLQMANLATRTRLYVKRTPWLYRPAKRLTGRGAADHLCSRDSQLCIEGYPSSGNSFSFAVLRLANPQVRIAHHCHSAANLRIALDYGVPAICLVRDPTDAIASRLARFSGSVREAVAEYVDFHDVAFACRDRLTVVTFDEVTRDTGRFLGRVTQASGVSFEVSDVDALSRAARDYMKQWTDRNDDPGRISLPNDAREYAKQRLRASVRSSARFAEAEALWRALVRSAGDAIEA